jgi:hypothetical protein
MTEPREGKRQRVGSTICSCFSMMLPIVRMNNRFRSSQTFRDDVYRGTQAVYEHNFFPQCRSYGSPLRSTKSRSPCTSRQRLLKDTTKVVTSISTHLTPDYHEHHERPTQSIRSSPRQKLFHYRPIDRSLPNTPHVIHPPLRPFIELIASRLPHQSNSKRVSVSSRSPLA